MILLLVSLIVCLTIARKRNAWGWIVLYWAVLCVKNLRDVVS